ncbi:MAG: hypothetical protein ACO1SV_26775 [Fimbriimonas sp.]
MNVKLVPILAALALTSLGFAQEGFGGRASAPKPAVVKAGEWIPGGDLRYRVLRVQTGLKEYIQRYEQNRLKYTPLFEADQLVVIEFEVENLGEVGVDPTGVGFKLVDSEGGVSALGQLDARLQSQVVAAGVPQHVGLSPRAELAPKGRTKLAFVFSVSREARPKGLEMYQAQRTITQGAIVLYTGPLLATASLDRE